MSDRSASLTPRLIDSPAAARLILPPLSLTSCIRAVLVRNTEGLALDERDRYNYFPASPNCCLSWFFSGESHMIDPGPGGIDQGPRHRLPDRVIFNGPFNRPVVSWNPGPVHALMLLIVPDALQALTGIDPGAWLNRAAPADQVLDAPWMSFCEDVFAAADDTQLVSLIARFLDPPWQALRPASPGRNRLVADWSDGLALRAANSGLGRSLRQVERRIKQWTGQPLRELRGMGRAERAFFEAILADERGALSWTDVACDAGYTDQSHFCRQSRRITGFSPDVLRREIAQAEAFWPYRLWGFGEFALGATGQGVPEASRSP